MECFWSHLEFNGLILSVKWGITNLDAESLCQAALVVNPWIALKGVKHGGIYVAGGWIAHEIQSSCRSRGTESRCWPVRVKLSGLKVGKVKRAHLWDFLHLSLLASKALGKDSNQKEKQSNGGCTNKGSHWHCLQQVLKCPLAKGLVNHDSGIDNMLLQFRLHRGRTLVESFV